MKKPNSWEIIGENIRTTVEFYEGEIVVLQIRYGHLNIVTLTDRELDIINHKIINSCVVTEKNVEAVDEQNTVEEN